MNDKVIPESAFQRALYGVLAVLSLGVAFVGAMLPGIPATEFVLLALWFASRSSPQLRHWIEHRSCFAESIRCWKEEGAIKKSTRYKAAALCLMGLAVLIMLQPPVWLTVLAVVGMSTGQIFIWSRPYPETDVS